ncbi:unnamed protein product [Dovyalis caffra]|uniref:Protein kinase domain-containing protein n=1 Tax=Dovyalis caffra TaxID=77055 RepID=A0AAV1RWG3_9ROSI|nr:unnamed protein product [Dovyalis caffra]
MLKVETSRGQETFSNEAFEGEHKATFLKLSSPSCNPPYHPHDVKSSNVLLDSDFQAQVADLGFAKLILNGATHVTTRVKGTLGYLAPEYAMLGKASENCDVYSFGILC